MPDSADLYSDDRPDARKAPDGGCYFSRWVMPIDWFWFFRPGDIRLIDVDREGSTWQEVRLSAEKAGALALFMACVPLLVAMSAIVLPADIGGENKMMPWKGSRDRRGANGGG